MARSKRQLVSFVLMLVLLVPILVACGGGETATTAPAGTTPTADNTGANTTPAVATEPAATAAATVEATAPVTPTAEVEPTAAVTTTTGTGPDMAKTIIVGMTQSPDTLFGIESTSSATTQVLAGIQPTCVTTLSYEYQAVCFEELPTFENGAAVTETVKVDSTYKGSIVVNEELITDTSTLTEEMELTQFQVTFKILEGLTWEDGEPVTADDFVFAYKLYGDPGIQNAARFVLDRTADVVKVDDKTFTWLGAPGYSDATYFVNYFGPEPEHVLGSVDPATIGASDYAQKPLAYGPYKVVSHSPADQTELVANEYYWKKDQGLPKVGNIVYKYLTSEDQVLQQLEGGEIDVVGQIGLTLANTPKLDELEAAGLIVPQYVPATVWEHLDFGIERGDGNASFFEDVKVRQAVAYAINRQQIIDDVLFGKTVVMNTFLPETHWAYPPNGEGLEPYEYDVEKAKALLTEAGWVAGADGILEKDGRKFEIEFFTTEGNQTRQSVAQILQENLKEVGINVNLNFVPGPDVLFKNGEEGTLSGRRFDIALYAWVSGSEPSVLLYTCDQIPTPENNYAGQNNPGYCNTAFDEPGLAALAETDRAKRTPLFIEAQKVFNADLPTFPLYQRVNVGASRTGVEGLMLDPTSQVDFYNIDEWDITK